MHLTDGIAKIAYTALHIAVSGSSFYIIGADVSESDKQCLVNGVVMTTRGLGNHGDKKLKKCMLVEPYTTCVPIDQYAQFVILATQGVWEVFTQQEAASLLIRVCMHLFLNYRKHASRPD